MTLDKHTEVRNIAKRFVTNHWSELSRFAHTGVWKSKRLKMEVEQLIDDNPLSKPRDLEDLMILKDYVDEHLDFV